MQFQTFCSLYKSTGIFMRIFIMTPGVRSSLLIPDLIASVACLSNGV